MRRQSQILKINTIRLTIENERAKESNRLLFNGFVRRKFRNTIDNTFCNKFWPFPFRFVCCSVSK